MARPIPVFRRTDSIEQLLESLEEAGAAIVLNVVGDDYVDMIENDVRPYLEHARKQAGEIAGQGGEKTVRIGSVLAKAPRIVPIIDHPLLRRVCDHFLLRNCSNYRLSSTHIVEVSPGDEAGHLHRDDVLWPMKGERGTLVINCLVSLTDFTATNGSTLVLVGSNKWPRNDQKVGPGKRELDCFETVPYDHLAPAVMPKGSVLILLGGVIHCTGPSFSDSAPRRALGLSYNLGWLRQEENLYLTVPPETVDALPKSVQELIGYSIHAPYLGHTGFD